jgi:hypothetical protein
VNLRGNWLQKVLDNEIANIAAGFESGSVVEVKVDTAVNATHAGFLGSFCDAVE